MDFPASVAPFILRGITLYGIDSVMLPVAATSPPRVNSQKYRMAFVRISAI